MGYTSTLKHIYSNNKPRCGFKTLPFVPVSTNANLHPTISSNSRIHQSSNCKLRSRRCRWEISLCLILPNSLKAFDCGRQSSKMPKSTLQASCGIDLLEDAHSCVRFSKLFMSHLDDEFKKQSLPELKSLLPSQVSSVSINRSLYLS